MNREEKADSIAQLQERLGRAKVTLLANPQGLTVAQVTQLRRVLREAGAEFKVAKNTLTRLAIADTKYAALRDMLEGPNGLVFAYGDPIAAAKALIKFAEGNAKLTIRGGVLEGTPLAAEAVADLAKLPSKEVLIAQLLGLLQAPAGQLLRTINEPGARIVRLLDRVRASRAEAGN